MFQELTDDLKRLREATTLEAKVDILGNVICNDIIHVLKWMDVKITFILVFIALVLGLTSLMLAQHLK